MGFGLTGSSLSSLGVFFLPIHGYGGLYWSGFQTAIGYLYNAQENLQYNALLYWCIAKHFFCLYRMSFILGQQVLLAVLSQNDLPITIPNIAAQLEQLVFMVLQCCCCYCSINLLSIYILCWDFTTLTSLNTMSSKLKTNAQTKGQAPGIKRYFQPWESINPYSCRERLVRGHPQSSLLVRDQPIPLIINKLPTNAQNSIQPSNSKHWILAGVIIQAPITQSHGASMQSLASTTYEPLNQ